MASRSNRSFPAPVRHPGGGNIFATAMIFAIAVMGLLMVLLTWRLGMGALPAYLLAVNSTTLLAYGYDKSIAGGRRTRVPERVLHLLALAGGTPGAMLGQILFRHKTLKRSFRTWFWIIVLIQLTAVGAWIWWQGW